MIWQDTKTWFPDIDKELCNSCNLCRSLCPNPLAILSGQTIGVFKNKMKAKWGLNHSRIIYLRYTIESEEDLWPLGLKGDRIKSTFDDALFCDKTPKNEIFTCLNQNGIYTDKPFIAAHFHYWGQATDTQIKTARRFAELHDYLIDEFQVQILLIPMSWPDEAAERNVIQCMKNPACFVEYKYDYKLLGESFFTFTLKHHPIIFSFGECVPAVSASFNDYYFCKNKGALMNCNLEVFCLNLKGFIGEEIKEDLKKSIDGNTRIRKQIKVWLQSAKRYEKNLSNDILKAL